METITQDTPRSLLYPKGLILWRPCSFDSQSRATLESVSFLKTDKGSYMTHVMDGNFIAEPEIGLNGLAVFTNNLPIDNWTHLIVENVSKRMHETIDQNPTGEGCAIFAITAIPYKIADYLDFRSRMASAYRQVLDGSKFQLTLDIWPVGWKPQDIRCYRDNDEFAIIGTGVEV